MMLKAGEWNTISMSVNLGTAGEANRSVSVTTNGVTRSCNGILWRTDPNCKLCALNFVAFFGEEMMNGILLWIVFVCSRIFLFRLINSGVERGLS